MRTYLESAKSAHTPSWMCKDLMQDIQDAIECAKGTFNQPELRVSSEYFKALQKQMMCFDDALFVGGCKITAWRGE